MSIPTPSTIHRRAAVVSIALVSALTLAGCGEDGTTEGAPGTPETPATSASPSDSQAAEHGTGAGDVAALTFGELAADPEAHIGDTVTVHATIADIVTPQVFTITRVEGTTIDPMIVVDTDASAGELTYGDPVTVTGEVKRRFDLLTTESFLEIQLDDELLADWKGEPYLRAENVEPDTAKS